jgi:hypothetical protein
LLPNVMDEQGQIRQTTPEDLREMRDYIAENRPASTPFDIVMEGQTPGNDPKQAAEIVQPWAAAGATWWIESMWEAPRDGEGLELVRQRILDGPPRLN